MKNQRIPLISLLNEIDVEAAKLHETGEDGLSAVERKNTKARSVSRPLCKRETIVNHICATIIVGFIFSLALSCLTPLTKASNFQPQNEERISINTASIEELQRLPGIGPALASRIVEHRRRHGLFKRPQDIIIVRGMSAKLYRRIAHLIRA